MTEQRFPAYGLHRRVGGDAQALARELANAGWRVYVLPADIRSEGDFVEGVIGTVPLDPPLQGRDRTGVGRRWNWDALNDSLGGGLIELPETRIALIWPNHRLLANADPNAYQTAFEILGGLTWTLADPDMTGGKPRQMLVLMTEPGLPPLLRGTWTVAVDVVRWVATIRSRDWSRHT
jgi:hypothetical protein